MERRCHARSLPALHSPAPIAVSGLDRHDVQPGKTGPNIRVVEGSTPAGVVPDRRRQTTLAMVSFNPATPKRDTRALGCHTWLVQNTGRPTGALQCQLERSRAQLWGIIRGRLVAIQMQIRLDWRREPVSRH